jgi:hypothetical protein
LVGSVVFVVGRISVGLHRAIHAYQCRPTRYTATSNGYTYIYGNIHNYSYSDRHAHRYSLTTYAYAYGNGDPFPNADSDRHAHRSGR